MLSCLLHFITYFLFIIGFFIIKIEEILCWIIVVSYSIRKAFCIEFILSKIIVNFKRKFLKVRWFIRAFLCDFRLFRVRYNCFHWIGSIYLLIIYFFIIYHE